MAALQLLSKHNPPGDLRSRPTLDYGAFGRTHQPNSHHRRLLADAFSESAMTEFELDLAISAVGYDSLLVRELKDLLQPRLEQPVVWAGHESEDSSAPLPMLGSGARIVLVLLHPLWSKEPLTAEDSGVLRQRMKRRPKSVVVLVLDGATVPSWLERAHCHSFATEGIAPLLETVLSCIRTHGGLLKAIQPEAPAPPPILPMYRPVPFLKQPRAHTVLKRQLEQLAVELNARLAGTSGDKNIQVFAVPNRLIARQATGAISFSWLGGRSGSVSDGRLLVIEWSGIPIAERGAPSLKTASMTREVTYAAAGTDAATWCWRADELNGRASSTADLVGEWLDVAALQPATS